MDFNDRINKLFGKQFTEYYTSDIDEIREYISQCKDEFSILKYNLDNQDMVKRIKDRDYLSYLGYEYLDNGIKILMDDIDFWYDIRDSIPKSIRSLRIPNSYFDIAFFSNFPNLDTIIIDDVLSLTEEDFEILYNKTNIKKIIVNGAVYVNFSGILVKDTSKIGNNLIYKDIILSEVNPYMGKMMIDTYDLDKDRLNKLYRICDNNSKDVSIETADSRYKIKFINEKTIDYINIESKNISDIELFYNYLVKNGYEIKKINFHILTNEYENLDVSSLENISTKVMFSFRYGDDDEMVADYAEFKGLVECIKWYRKIIIEANLSPVEKVMFAYDIMKTLEYQDDMTKSANSRMPHLIVETGKVVCIGYSYMLNLILNGIDDGINLVETEIMCDSGKDNEIDYHSRIMVKIDDLKYDINGIYILDATYDSVLGNENIDFFKRNGIDDSIDNYNGLDLYVNFLIPYEDYVGTYPYDTLPILFQYYDDCLKKGKNVSLINEFGYVGAKMEADNLFDGNISGTKLNDYLGVSRISLSVFNEILYNVRMAEGYDSEMALYEVDKIDKINKGIVEIMQKENPNIKFFDDGEGRIPGIR